MISMDVSILKTELKGEASWRFNMTKGELYYCWIRNLLLEIMSLLLHLFEPCRF